MQSLYNFIVSPKDKKRYNNTKKIGAIDFVVSSSEEDHTRANREAMVLEVPRGYNGPIKKGYTLIVHHNTFKFYNDVKGRRKSGRSFFRDDIFLLDDDQIFMFYDGNDWNAFGRFCFVSPIKKEDYFLDSFGSEHPLTGIMEYPNKYLEDLNIFKGDKVIFSPDSEYEFEIDNRKMYRMYDSSIVAKYGDK